MSKPDPILDLAKRVDAYFQTGQPREPAGRLILDLWHMVRAQEYVRKKLDEIYPATADVSVLLADAQARLDAAERGEHGDRKPVRTDDGA